MGAPSAAAHRDPAQGRAPELEELPALPVRRPAAPRLGVGSAAGLAAVAVLLAAGFGLLGGRPEPSPSPALPTGGGVASSPEGPAPTPASARPTPMVTPWTACASPPDPAAPPEVVLQTGGVPVPGAVTQVPDGPAPEPEGRVIPRAEIRPDVITEIWIDGGACAVEWRISLFDPVVRYGYGLDVLANNGRDPGVAAQNRFLLGRLPEFRGLGHDLQLRALLTFGGSVVRATWDVRILPLDAPPVTLSGASGEPIPLAWGCDVRLTLGNGWSEGPECQDDLMDEPARFRVRPGDALTLSFDGWGVDNMVVTCGRLSALSFVAEPALECLHRLRSGGPFGIPDSGAWALQLAACGSQPGAGNRLCGSWYALIEVR